MMAVHEQQDTLVKDADQVMADIHSYYSEFIECLTHDDRDGAISMLLNLCSSCDDLQDIANLCGSEEKC